MGLIPESEDPQRAQPTSVFWRRDWQATVHRVAKRVKTRRKQLSMQAQPSFNIYSFIILGLLACSSMQDLLFWLTGLVVPWHVRS